MTQNPFAWVTRGRFAAIIIAVSLLLVANWLNTHTTIVIDASGAKVGAHITYKLINQSSGSTISISTVDTHLKRMVPRANYEVEVVAEDRSFVSLTKTKPFLQTTTIGAQLVPEKERTFVGNEPGPCMFYQNVLYSYDCGQDLTSLKVHVPATATDPTYIQNADFEGASIEGIITLNGQGYVLSQPFAGDDVAPTHVLYPLTPSLTFNANTPLPDLKPDMSYAVKAFKDGFVAYDSTNFEDIKFYASGQAAPQVIELGKPTSPNAQTPAALSVNSTQVATLYNSLSTDGDRGNDADANQAQKSLKGVSELIVQNSGDPKHFKFGKLYTAGGICGNDKACLLSGNTLDMYDISGDKAALLYRLPNIQAIQYVRGQILLVNDQGLMALNPDTLSGSFLYSFGSYTYCGLAESDAGYMLCVTNPQGESSALYLSDQVVSSAIDKQVLKLRSSSLVTNVSAYGPYLYVTPQAGELVYRPDLHGYGYDLGQLNSTNAAIEELVNKIGIDRSKYQIIPTYK
jgi:hypothetical protein